MLPQKQPFLPVGEKGNCILKPSIWWEKMSKLFSKLVLVGENGGTSLQFQVSGFGF
jgi:hypothetical protein